MKQIIVLISILLSFTTAGFGADWDGQMPPGTSDLVRVRIGEVIRAGVDPDRAITLTRRMEENRFGEGHKIRVCEIISAAQREGLPTDPIMNKAYEGMAKGVETERIVQAMEAVRSRYSHSFHQARTLTAEEKQQRVLGQMIAEGLAAGIMERDLAQMIENLQLQTQQLNREQKNELSLQSFQIARDMARLGVISSTLTDVVCKALQNHFTAQQMEQMRNSFMSEARYGRADSIARQYGAQIGAGSTAAGLRSPGAGAGSGPRGSGSGGMGSGGSGGGGSGGSGSGGSGGSGSGGSSGRR